MASKGATPRRLIVVVLNSPDRFNRARGLIRQGWAVYDPWLDAGAPVQDRNAAKSSPCRIRADRKPLRISQPT